MISQDRLMDGLQELPPLPAAVVEILEALNQQDVAFDILKEKISQDPALSSKVLTVSNSPFYGMSGQIGSIKDACIVLGIHTLKNIAVAAGIMKNFPPDSGNHIKASEIWRHAIGTGVSAKLLACNCTIDEETAFTVGLLHDIGKMILDHCFPDEYEEVLKVRDNDDCLLYEAEQKVLGIDHGVVGAIVAERWHLPEVLVQTLRGHHDGNPNNGTLTDLLRVADIVSRGLGIGDPGDSLMPALDPDGMARLGLDMPTILELLPLIDVMESHSEVLLQY